MYFVRIQTRFAFGSTFDKNCRGENLTLYNVQHEKKKKEEKARIQINKKERKKRTRQCHIRS